jgi:Common central domain of tyrosinase/Polyphenol oxidase middle domain
MNSGAALTSRTTSIQRAIGIETFSDPVQISFGGVETGPIHFNNGFGALEDQPHNQVHDAVGGQPTGNCADGWMSDPNCAAQDPIFYLHHSNIDRIWKRWLDLGQGRSNPTNRVWLDQVFSFYDESGGQKIMTPADALDTVKDLNYAYDDDPARVAAAAAPHIGRRGGPRRVVKPREVRAATGPITLGPDGGAATLLPTPETAPTFKALAVTEPPAHVYLHIQDIHVAEHPGVLYEVFLNLPDKMSPAAADDHYVGMLNFFGSSHAHRGMGASDASPMEHIYDITDLVRRLSKAGAWDPKQVNVKFVPSSGTDVDPAKDISLGKPGQVHVGQIRITYG